jgi:hypothetical protein
MMSLVEFLPGSGIFHIFPKIAKSIGVMVKVKIQYFLLHPLVSCSRRELAPLTGDCGLCNPLRLCNPLKLRNPLRLLLAVIDLIILINNMILLLSSLFICNDSGYGVPPLPNSPYFWSSGEMQDTLKSAFAFSLELKVTDFFGCKLMKY